LFVFTVRGLLRRLGILKQDAFYHAARRHSAVIKEIQKQHGAQVANQALAETDAMMIRLAGSRGYDPAEAMGDVAQFLRAKYLPDTLSKTEG
jgi:hypothetical protein